MLVKVLLGISSVDGVTSLLPVGGADFSVFINETESFHKAQGFVNRAAYWGLVQGNLAEDTLGVNQEVTTQGVARILEKNTVLLRDLVVDVSKEWDVDASQTSILSGGVDLAVSHSNNLVMLTQAM